MKIIPELLMYVLLISFIGITWQSAMAEDIPASEIEVKKTFHRPKTAPEKVLDTILPNDADIYQKDYPLFMYVTGQSNDDYEGLFTKTITNAYRNAVSVMETKAVQKNCGGKYIKGEDCGIEINPISCAQDVPTVYFYRTLKMDKKEAIIVYHGQKKLILKQP